MNPKEVKIEEEKYVKWFSELGKKDVNLVGGKAANLGEMLKIEMPVPQGFVITSEAYEYFLEKTDLKEKIYSILGKIDVNNTEELEKVAREIREIISSSEMPEDMEKEIIENYEIFGFNEAELQKATPNVVRILKTSKEPVFVAVRSSATAEDSESISENEQVLLKIDGKPFYGKIKDIYEKLEECSNHIIEVPAMRENRVEWVRAKTLLKHFSNKSKLHKIKTVTGREIVISPDHTLISLNESTLKPEISNISKIKINTKIPVIGSLPEINKEEPVVVSDYVRGDEVIERDNKIMIKNKSFNWGIQHGLPKKIKVSEDFAYFLGLYAAEGSTYKNNCISITNSNITLLKKIESFCRKLGIYKYSKINKYSVRVYSPSLVRFLHETCGSPLNNKKGKGKLCSEKKVPNFVFGWSKKKIGTFLRGCFDGDGTVGKNQVSYFTTSEMLAGGMAKLLEILGIGFYINRGNKLIKMYIQLSDIIKFAEIVGFEDLNKKQKLLNLIENYKNRKKHPEFKYNLFVGDILSTKIKDVINQKLPTKELDIALCKICENKIEQTSYYKNKKRYYCKTCKKAFYENQIEKKSLSTYDYFDEKGMFKKGMKPWNYGLFKGKLSLNELKKLSRKYKIDNIFSIFNGTVKWEEIKEISTIENKGFLYDFSVPEVENFAAGLGGIITHNSASFAGQQETFLNVKGKIELIESIKKCFASLFTARSIYYRIKKGFKHEDVLIAVVIQLMINSDKSGVIFSKDPVFMNDNVVVEAVFGLGEGIVSGKIQPDHYVVSRELKIIEKNIAEKKIALVRNSAGKTETIRLTEDKSKQQVLKDYEIKKLADFALKLEEHYNQAQDIEFAIDSGNIFIVQTRPVTTLGKEIGKEEVSGKVLLEGLAASPGIGSGIVKIVRNLQDLSKIKKGDVLVTEMTNPDMVVTMQKCSAIITDEGGVTAHAAIVSREMGIPAVVGTKQGTKILKDEMIVTVDGFKGKIYEGKIEELKEKKIEILPIVETKTKIKVTVDLPDFASRAAKTNCKEVGLVRIEGIIAESGKHPFYFLKQNKIEEYEKIIFSGLSKISEYFDELWIRTSDIRSDEFRNLQGAGEIEANPMLGMHGIRAGLKFSEILKTEIKAMAKLNEDKKIGLMLPQIISVSEVQETKKLLDELEIENLSLGVMIETPAAVEIIEELCKEGIDFISFGTNDLTQYTLAIDRGNEEVQYLYDEMNPAVLSQIKKVISVCKRYGVETSICGQAANKKEMVEFLVKLGIDSISVNADKAYEISNFVKELEASKGNEQDELAREGGLRELKQEDKEVQEEKRIEEKTKKKEKHKVNCSVCKKETEVPFKPDGIRPVYCRECFEIQRQKKLIEREQEKKKEEAEEQIEKSEEIEQKKTRELKKTVEEVSEELKEKAEKIEEIIKEGWQDLNFGIDVFASQQKGEKTDETKEKEEKTKESFYEPESEKIISGEEGTEIEEEKEEKAEIKEEKDESEQILDIF